jgi:hypothetical protein
MKKFPLQLALLFVLQTVSAQKVYKIPVAFDSCVKPPLTDYSLVQNWSALPTKKDQADFVPQELKDNQSSAKADLFYIHPTTFQKQAIGPYQWNADVNDQEENESVDKSPVKFQASIFNGSCKVYAPRYRQAHMYCFRTKDLSDKWKALDYAYQDIRNAFLYYLKNYNHNRPIVIASHSQGTIHAARLLKEFFSDTLKKKLVVAYIIGMPVPTDSLPAIDFCHNANQTQCWVSWRSYEHGFVPDNPWVTAEKAICINPITWEYNENYVPKELSKGTVLLPAHKVLPNRCDAQVHGGILWVNKPRFRGSVFYRNPNYHIADLNFYYMDIRLNVENRINEYLLLNRTAN